MRRDLIAIGESMAVITPALPEPLEGADELSLSVGGAESNVAIHLASDGFDVAWVSRLGDDPLGRKVLSFIGGYGVDVSAVEIDPSAPTGLYFKDPGPRVTDVYYYRRGSAASKLDVPAAERLPLSDFRVVHLTGITPGLGESCSRYVHRIVERVAGLPDTILSFDVNHRPLVWPVSEAAPALLELARCADIVFVGRDEAEGLWGAHTADDVRDLLPDAPTLVVKDGSVGAHEYRDARTVFAPAFRVEVVEPVGAGDGFAAGYLAALLTSGIGGEVALNRGHEVAALVLASTNDIGERRRAAMG